MDQLLRAAVALCGAALLQSCTRAADPYFYVVDVQDGGAAQLHTVRATVDQGRKLPVAFLDEKQSDCCFVFGDRPVPAPDNGNPERTLTTDDAAGHVFGGRFTSGRKRRPDEAPGLGFGFDTMQGARRIDARTHEVTFAAAAPVYVRSCTTGEGIRIELRHAPGEATPYADYYYYLGIDIEPDCPERPDPA